MNDFFVCLDNIRSLYNIGAILRTCSFFGIRNVILLGYSGKIKLPDGSTGLNKRVNKTSLGSENDLNIILMDTEDKLLEFAMNSGLTIISFEQTTNSISFNEWKPSKNSILVFGNEKEGISGKILGKSNKVVEIVRQGEHNSLNVEVTCGIVIHKVVTTAQ